jgi:hypothetical protein
VLEESFLTAVIGGFVGGLCLAMWLRDSCSWLRLASSVRFLLYTGTTGGLLVVGLVIGHHNSSPIVGCGAVVSIIVSLVLDGLILAAVVTTLGFKSSASVGRNQLWCTLTSRQTTFAVRSLAASYFLMVSISKWITQNEHAFFLASGYGDSFYAFICLFECLCAIGLLIDPLVVPTVALLWIEMLGAIYTHFHNYLVKGFSDPLSNSLDAFRMLIVLTFIALASRRCAMRCGR